MPQRVLIGAAVGVTACGSAAPARLPCPPPVRSGAHAAVGPISVTTDRSRLHGGTAVTFTVLVTGPAAYQAACDGPLQLLVADTSDQHVYSGKSAPAMVGGCGDVTLAEGQRQVYNVSWQPEPTLPAGTYEAVLLMGDQPGLTVPLVVEAGPEQGGRCG